MKNSHFLLSGLSVFLFLFSCSGDRGKALMATDENDVLPKNDYDVSDTEDSEQDAVVDQDNSDDITCTEGATKTGTDSCGLNGRGLIVLICVSGVWQQTEQCKDPDMCKDDAVTYRESCGLNNRGLYLWNCLEGQWKKSKTCNDNDECKDDDLQPVEGVLAQKCGLNNNGTTMERCIEGKWRTLSEEDPYYCDDPDECKNDAVEHMPGNAPCGKNGRGITQRRCVDGTWHPIAATDSDYCDDPDECTDGSIMHKDEIPDNRCGINLRGWLQQRCVNGLWTDISEEDSDYCDDPDECKDDTVAHREETDEHRCGLNNRGWMQKECITGKWNIVTEGSEYYCDDPDECIDETEDVQSGKPCGYYRNGHIKKVCELGRWVSQDTCVFQCEEHIVSDIPDITSRYAIDNIHTATIIDGDLKIYQYDSDGHKQIDSLEGFDCLKKVTGRVYIMSSDTVNLSEFHSLERVEGVMILFDDKQLVSLDGLKSLRFVNALGIKNNPNLLSIKQLKSLNEAPFSDTEQATVLISENTQLPQCQVDDFIQFLQDDLGFTGITESSENNENATCE